MIRIATERAHTQGLDNVEFHVVDADRMAPPANGFDATVCRWALMFFADPPAASSHPPRTQAGWLAASTVGQPGPQSAGQHRGRRDLRAARAASPTRCTGCR